MKNWHYIVGGVMVLLFAQGYYFARLAVAEFDMAIGLPELPYNPYSSWPYILTAATELVLCSLVAHSAINGPFKPFTKALWVFIGLSAWNQFVDSVWGDMYSFSISEGIFLIVAILAALISWKRWTRQVGLT